MTTDFLYRQSEVLVALALLALMVLGAELGYRFGQRRQASTEPTRTEILGIQAAILGLFSLLLGFTFAMALSRFEYRKQIVVEESNAIGTAALRADFLPAPHDKEAREAFRRYVEIRLESVLRTTQRSSARVELDTEARQLQRQLWRMASDAAAADPQSVPLGLFVHGVNQLIDIKMKRDIAVANHVPESVLLLLLVFAILAGAVLGHGNSLAGTRITHVTAVHFVIVVSVILLIMDLDRPQTGLARVSQESMIHLAEILDDGPR